MGGCRAPVSVAHDLLSTYVRSTLGVRVMSNRVTGKGDRARPHGARGKVAAQRAAAKRASPRQVTSVPAATFNAVGAGTAAGLNATSGQPPLTANGKPEVVYMGGEFCPYCAAERWALTAALGRFGTFTGLNLIHSSPTDVYPSTPTISFHGFGYTSKFL